MSYICVKTIKGRRYRYSQTSKRVDGRVKTTSVYLGPADGERRRERALASAQRQADAIDAYQRATFGETGQERKDREAKERTNKVYMTIGLTPPSAPFSSASSPAPAPARTSEAPSPEPASPPAPEQPSEPGPSSEPGSEHLS
jgi:hypothetical protein